MFMHICLIVKSPDRRRSGSDRLTVPGCGCCMLEVQAGVDATAVGNGNLGVFWYSGGKQRRVLRSARVRGSGCGTNAGPEGGNG